MYKTIDPDSFGFDGPIFEQIKISSRGLLGHDKAAFEKRAATSLFKDFDRLVKSATEDEPLYHLIAMGATEYTGPNRNGDGWRADVLRQTHPTFVKYSKFYSNHKNQDPAKSYGVVKASAFNEAMPRVELVVGFNGDKVAAKRNNGLVATNQLQKLASGKPLPVSMSCKLSADVCSYCGNSAPSPSHYCTGTDEGGQCKAGGLKNRMGQLREVDGDIHHLHADNPNNNLVFFDISDVMRGADRTAYVVGALTKAAAATGCTVKSAELAELLGVMAPLDVLMANMQFVNPTVAKLACDLARIESEISSGQFWNANYYLPALKSADDAFTDGMSARPGVAAELTKTARAGEAAIFGSLTRNKICLSPAAFLQVFGGYSQEKAAAWAAAVTPFLPNSFNRLLDSGCVAVPAYAAADGLQKTASHAIIGKHLDLFSVFSVAKQHVQKSAMAASLQLKIDTPDESSHVNAGSVTYEREAASNLISLANTYALYKLAFATAAKCDPFELQMIVLQNYNTR